MSSDIGIEIYYGAEITVTQMYEMTHHSTNSDVDLTFTQPSVKCSYRFSFTREEIAQTQDISDMHVSKYLSIHLSIKGLAQDHTLTINLQILQEETKYLIQKRMKYLIHLFVMLVAFNLSHQRDFKRQRTERDNILADLKKEVEKASFQDELADEQENEDQEDNKVTQQYIGATEQQEDDGVLQLQGMEQEMTSQDEAKSQGYYYRLYRRYRGYYYQQLQLHKKYKHLYNVYYRSNKYCMHHMTHGG